MTALHIVTSAMESALRDCLSCLYVINPLEEWKGTPLVHLSLLIAVTFYSHLRWTVGWTGWCLLWLILQTENEGKKGILSIRVCANQLPCPFHPPSEAHSLVPILEMLGNHINCSNKISDLVRFFSVLKG